jgi:hypothetical protein
MLRCADVGRSSAFYEGLGLRPIVAEPDVDGALRYARLRLPDGDATLSLERGQAGAAPFGGVIYLECDDLEQRVNALAAAGYAIAAGPEMKPWLWREAELVDPDGHRVCLYHAGTYRLDPPWRLAGSEGGARDHEDGDEAEDEDGLLRFRAGRNRGYLDAAIPSARDDEIAAYIERLIARGPEARDRAAARLVPAYTSTLLAFAERMATRAVRERDPRRALQGLLAIALVWREAPDVREAIPVLAVLHDAAARAGADPSAIFGEVAALAPTDVAPVFPSFLTRDDLHEIAAEMGYSAGRDRDGFRYRRKWGAGRIDADED